MLTAAVALGPGPGAAQAAVEIGAKKIVVSSPAGSSAVVKRSPVRVAFRNDAGRTVLRQVSGHGSGPRALAPYSQSQFLLPDPPPPTRYVPFGFLVGEHDYQQVDGGQWHANLQAVSGEGTTYGATEVLRAGRRRGGVRMVLATDDPSARRLRVDIAPGKRGFDVEVKPSSRAGIAGMADSFVSPADEAFHGFGGRHNQIDQRGKSFYGQIQQQNVGTGVGDFATAPTNPERDRYLFPNGESAAYYAQNLFVSSAGYGFLLDQSELSLWRLGADRGGAWQVEAFADELDYTVVPGDEREAVEGVSALNGRHRVPPAWAQGSILDRAVAFPVDSPDGYLANFNDDLAEIKRTGTRIDAYRIEGWEFFSRAQLKSMIARLTRLGIKPMIYFRLFVGEDQIGTDDPDDYAEAIEQGYVATHSNGEPYTFTSNFFRNAAVIDFTDPRAVRWWKGRIREGLRLGAEGFMQDFGEQVMGDMHFEDGTTGEQMHNRLATLAHRATRHAIERFEKRHPKRHIFFFTRTGFSPYEGVPGGRGAAAYESANFPGDETTDFSRASGLASQTNDMLSRAVAGNYGYTTDIGGYFDVGPYQATSKQLFIRWAQWAALSPLFRLHGSVLNGVHTPWRYDEETVALYKRLIRLHVRARQLTRRLWKRAQKTGIPPTRPMWLQFPGDREAAKQDQQWMLGPDVLVAPVVVEDATARRVYFPRGCWKHPETGERHRGPGYGRTQAPLDTLPYFFRCKTTPFQASPGRAAGT